MIRTKHYAKFNKLIDHFDYARLRENNSFSRPNHDRWLKAMAAKPGERWKHCTAINNSLLQDHEQYKATVYIVPSQPNRHGQGMWGIDVDCHKSGTVEGAIKAAEMLAYYLPGVHTETSTHGKGVHGYVIVDYQNHGPEDTKWIKETYVKFIKTLNRKAKHIGIDIELIEPKGLSVNVVKAVNGSMNITDSKQGVLIKAPRDIKAAIETCVLTIEQLEQLTDEIAATIPEEKKEEPKKAKGNGGNSDGNGGSGDGGGDAAGSNVMFNEDEYDRLVPLARQIHYASNLKQVVLTNRVKIEVEDIAAMLLILLFCKRHPREEHTNGALPGPMPCTRLRKLWTVMREAGIISRAYDPKRIACIRNLLADFQLLEFTSATYAPGKAMCWGITDGFHEVLKEKMLKVATQEEQLFALPSRINGTRPISLWKYEPSPLDYDKLDEFGLISSFQLLNAV